MQVANVWIQIDGLGSNCQKTNVTPAEAQVFKKQFGYKVSGSSKVTNPITHLDIIPTEVTRSNADEFERLTRKYGDKVIEVMFPGENPQLPKTFKEAGFESSKDKQPEAGEMHEILPLAKLPKEETQDEQSVAEIASRDKTINEQGKQIKDLTDAVNKLLAANKTATATVVPTKVEENKPTTP